MIYLKRGWIFIQVALPDHAVEIMDSITLRNPKNRSTDAPNRMNNHTGIDNIMEIDFHTWNMGLALKLTAISESI